MKGTINVNEVISYFLEPYLNLYEGKINQWEESRKDGYTLISHEYLANMLQAENKCKMVIGIIKLSDSGFNYDRFEELEERKNNLFEKFGI